MPVMRGDDELWLGVSLRGRLGGNLRDRDGIRIFSPRVGVLGGPQNGFRGLVVLSWSKTSSKVRLGLGISEAEEMQSCIAFNIS